MAEVPAERDALERRYQTARRDATTRGSDAVLQTFEDDLQRSNAVLACPLRKLEPIVSGSRDLMSTYYDIRRLRFPKKPVPSESDWDRIRPVADAALFGAENSRRVHYAAMSLDGRGLPGYGECSIVLNEPLIADRTSTFEENSCTFLQRHMNEFMRSGRLPRGHRSTWPERHKLAVAKLAGNITPTTKSAEFSYILLKPGAQPIDDQFVELHIFEAMTFSTFEKVTVTRKGRKPAKTRINALRDRLNQHNVPLEIE